MGGFQNQYGAPQGFNQGGSSQGSKMPSQQYGGTQTQVPQQYQQDQKFGAPIQRQWSPNQTLGAPQQYGQQQYGGGIGQLMAKINSQQNQPMSQGGVQQGNQFGDKQSFLDSGLTPATGTDLSKVSAPIQQQWSTNQTLSAQPSVNDPLTDGSIWDPKRRPYDSPPLISPRPYQ
jgi:hypothetical protein